MKKRKIYTLTDDRIDKIVHEFIDYVTNPMNKHRIPPRCYDPERFDEFRTDKPKEPQERALIYDVSDSAIINNDCVSPVLVWNLPKPHYNETRAHFISLIHQLYARFISTEDDYFKLNSTILQTQYRNYNHMLRVLDYMRIVCAIPVNGSKFQTNKYYIPYPERFFPAETQNQKVIADLEQLEGIFDKLRKENIQRLSCMTSKAFVKAYNENLKRFEITRYDDLQRFLTENEYETKRSRLYYTNVVQKLHHKKYKQIEGCDDNGRIYHIGSQLPKSLRQFTNIKYLMDCKNSHLVLFNYIILQYYFFKDNISINVNTKLLNKNYNKLFIILSKYIKDNNIKYCHYFSSNLCNYLIECGFDKSIIEMVKKIPADAWEYMHLTANGLLWDEFAATFQTPRDEMKKIMFRKVFYSYSKNVMGHNHYGVAFKERFPSVMKIIRYCKRTYNRECREQGITKNSNSGRDGVQLPHILMRLESAIFTDILKELFKHEDLHCFAIHDAIAVLDTYSPDYVESVMMKIYAKYGLCPTVSVETC